MARDKEWEARMQGMIYAFNIVKEGGIEKLEEDIRRRNILRSPMKFTSKQIEEYYEELSVNLYNNMLTTFLYTLNDEFGYGIEQLKAFKEALDKNIACTLDLDYMGEHYIKLEDYAKELNEKFSVGIDVSRVAMSQDSYDDKDEKFRTCRVEAVLKELRENGFAEAAKFLQKKTTM